MSDKIPTLVLVEDDFVDVELVRRGVARRGLNYQIYDHEDGERALEFLRSNALTPEQRASVIVLLDINMPGMNGHQFLDELRVDENLRRTIVFMLTTSNHPRDRMMAYDRNVAGYFTKCNLDGLLETVAEYAKHVEFPPLD